VSLHHGAYSERRITPRAAQIVAEARSSGAWPSYLDERQDAAAVIAWGRAEAVCALLVDYLSEQGGIEAALTETEQVESRMTTTNKGQRTTTKGRRTLAALDLLRRYEGHAARLRDQLGLTPLARARLGKDVAATSFDMARTMAALGAEDDNRELSG
jgi:hypothetical protein